MRHARRPLAALYTVAAVAGAVVPYVILLPAIDRHGVDLRAFARGIFANPAASVFSTDALMASVVFLLFVVVEGQRCGMRRLWAYPLLMIVFGLACAMPAFLAARDRSTTS